MEMYLDRYYWPIKDILDGDYVAYTHKILKQLSLSHNNISETMVLASTGSYSRIVHGLVMV